MERFLLLEIGAEGVAFETTLFDFYASWFGVGLLALSVVAFKIYRSKKAGA
jgi:hypothetical protein